MARLVNYCGGEKTLSLPQFQHCWGEHPHCPRGSDAFEQSSLITAPFVVRFFMPVRFLFVALFVYFFGKIPLQSTELTVLSAVFECTAKNRHITSHIAYCTALYPLSVRTPSTWLCELPALSRELLNNPNNNLIKVERDVFVSYYFPLQQTTFCLVIMSWRLPEVFCTVYRNYTQSEAHTHMSSS